MRRALLDTDIFSELLKRRDAAVSKAGDRYLKHYGQFTLTTITIMEMAAGFHQTQRPDRVRILSQEIDGHEILTLNDDNAFLAGQIYAELECNGLRIGVAWCRHRHRRHRH